MAVQVLITGTIVKKQNKPKKDREGKPTGEFYRSIIVDTGIGEEMCELEPEDFDRAPESGPVKVVQQKKLKVWNNTPRFVYEVTKVEFKT